MKLASLELQPFQIVFLRHSLALLAFLPFFLATKKKRIRKNDFFLIMLGALSAFTFASVFQIIGVNLSSATDGSFILAMEPIFSIGLAFIFLKERLTRSMFYGLFLALLGFIVLSGSTLNWNALVAGHWKGNLFFLVAVAGEAVFPIILKPLLKRYPPHVVAFYCLFCATCYMLPFQNAELLTTFSTIASKTMGGVVYLGLGCSFLACFLWLVCLKRFSISIVAISWFLQPLLGCLFALFLLQEPLTSNILWGGGFIVAALLLLTRHQKPHAEEKPIVPALQTPQIILRVQHPLWIPKAVTTYSANIHSAYHQRRSFSGELFSRHHDAWGFPKSFSDAKELIYFKQKYNLRRPNRRNRHRLQSDDIF